MKVAFLCLLYLSEIACSTMQSPYPSVRIVAYCYGSPADRVKSFVSAQKFDPEIAYTERVVVNDANGVAALLSDTIQFKGDQRVQSYRWYVIVRFQDSTGLEVRRIAIEPRSGAVYVDERRVAHSEWMIATIASLFSRPVADTIVKYSEYSP